MKKVTIPCRGGPVVSINCCSVMDCQRATGQFAKSQIAIAPPRTMTCASPAERSHDREMKSA